MTVAGERAEDRRNEVRHIYGAAQAAQYEAVWQLSDVWRGESENHVRTIAGLLHAGDRWLDVGCGTGYFLSRFPEVDRAGLDLSPDMLERARLNNQGVVELREGDMAIDVPEWHGRWDLTTSTGQAWGYLSSMREIERAARNMVGWTAPGGTLMIQPSDIADVTGHRPTYDFSGHPPAAGTVRVTGVIWSWYEEVADHTDMIFPSLDVWTEWLADDFDEIEVVNWPHDPPPPYLRIPPRVIVARGKRSQPADGRAVVTVEALADADATAGHREDRPGTHAAPDLVAATPMATDGEDAERIETERRSAVRENDAAWASLKADASSERARADAEQARGDRAEAEVARLTSEAELATRSSSAATGPNAARSASVGSLYDLPLSTLVARYAPWRPRVWRGIGRRIDRIRRKEQGDR